MDKKIIIIAIVVIILISSGCSMYATSRPKQIITASPKVTKRPRTVAPVTTAPVTVAPTTPPASTTVVYPGYDTGFIPLMPTPTFVLIPGANFPGLTGRRRDEASTYIITRYPRLTVRAVPLGSQINYDVRTDRVTLAYDPYTQRIVNARVG